MSNGFVKTKTVCKCGRPGVFGTHPISGRKLQEPLCRECSEDIVRGVLKEDAPAHRENMTGQVIRKNLNEV